MNMELDQKAENMVSVLKDIVLSGYANREDWKEGVNGYIQFFEKKNPNYKRLKEPFKYLYLKEALIGLSEELRGLCRAYDHMADSMDEYDEEDYEGVIERDRYIGGERMVETDIDIFADEK